jgi:hypothetical protein
MWGAGKTPQAFGKSPSPFPEKIEDLSGKAFNALWGKCRKKFPLLTN